MEIQFSIPMGPGSTRDVSKQRSTPSLGPLPPPPPPSSSSSPPPASSKTPKSSGPGTSRGGVHRFALDSRTRHTRRSSTRARTGCATCKKRHVKCDETKPSCLNCVKWRGYCDGYTDTSSAPSTPGPSSFSKLIHTKKAPLVVEEPSVNTIRFANSEQRAYFDEWASLSVMFLSGGLRQTRLWTTTLPQLSLEEPTLRYAAMAIGALRKAYAVEGLPIGSVLSDTNKDYLNAVIYYCEALRLQSQASPTHEGLRTAMLSSLLFICFETLRSNMPVALKHITHGFSMLNELAACTENAPSLVSIAPAPPSLVQELLDCYRPLEQQSRSFMGSYRRAFFSQEAGMPGQPDRNSNSRPHQHSPPAQLGSGNPSHTSYDPREYSSTPVSDFSPPGSSSSPTATGASSKPANSSPPSIPGSPWGIRETTTPPVQEPRSIQDDLPSPQSQTSPRSQGSQTPFRPQRPPGIMPFTKHSPYFRPKISNITSLETLPAVFASLEEAQGYWSLLQKQMVQNVPLLMSATSQLNLSKMTDDTELERRLASVKKDPKISAFVAESRKWLHRWIEAFDPLFEAKMRDRIRDMQRYLEAANLRIEYLILEIYTSMTRFSDVQVANGLTPQYRELNTLAEALLQARPNCGFAMDAGVTWPLFVSAYSCRDPSVRADAMRILEQYPIRNALRDSRVFRAIALRNDEAERESAEWGDGEQAHWLRLRRREMVFEDFGRSVIFRSVRLNAENQWTLIEEAADFTIQKDGSLLWKQQPISESMSILSGVC